MFEAEQTTKTAEFIPSQAQSSQAKTTNHSHYPDSAHKIECLHFLIHTGTTLLAAVAPTDANSNGSTDLLSNSIKEIVLRERALVLLSTDDDNVDRICLAMRHTVNGIELWKMDHRLSTITVAKLYEYYLLNFSDSDY